MSNKESILQVLQELKAEDPNFFCSHPHYILTWKSKKIEDALITKVNGQRYLGLLRKDVKGQDYWKYKPLTGNSDSEQSGSESSATQSNSSDSITKFQQRLEKTKNYANHANASKE